MPSTYELAVEPVTVDKQILLKISRVGHSCCFLHSLSPLQHPAGNTDLQENNLQLHLVLEK